jgi:thioredoxin reductase
MLIDTSSRIAVLGAGPIGLEAALYARFLGYDVAIYERGRVAENLLRFAHVRLFSHFSMNSSPLGLAALEAQHPSWQPPFAGELLTAGELVTSYLEPLAATDLLSGSVHENTTVLAVGRDGLLKGEHIGSPQRGGRPFRLLLRDAGGWERAEEADIVIDATGTYGNPNWLGRGGVPAVGEIAARSGIEYGLPDILGEQRTFYAGRHVAVIGAGYSAATNVINLAELAASERDTRITWITRGRPREDGPVALLADDRLPERHRTAMRANELARSKGRPVSHVPDTMVETVRAEGDGFALRLSGSSESEIQVDRLIANVGYRPDTSLYSELQVHECYATSGPIKLAAALIGSSADCLDQCSPGPQTLMNPEPDFFILGSKSFGRNSKFLLRFGLEQIRDVFTLIVGRAELDLYRTVKPHRMVAQT